MISVPRALVSSAVTLVTLVVLRCTSISGLRIAFTLNMMAGRCGKPSCGHTGSGPWDPSNAKALLTYTAKKYKVKRTAVCYESRNSVLASSFVVAN